MNINAYLERINYHGPTIPSAETLRALQLAHLQTVPFENLSIHAGETIVLEDAALFTKIVEHRRGGFCYECNGLFAALLRELGFEVTKLSAEVANAQGGYSQPFDHMTLLVGGPQRWLVDVGFGDSFLEPLLLDERSEQAEGEGAYKILDENGYLVLIRREANVWTPQYRFTLTPYEYADFGGMCRYHQTSPESHFTQKRVCSRATESGRITLSDMRLIETRDGERTERDVKNQQEYDAALQQHFGVALMRSERV
ncbi:MAG TPA: arylamine N-acetyltransferase [Pyrinomonadaceae bacterium]|nr:arylamine N-acetyltransferase [Pyrinomonadaceae bacterium]